MRIAAMNVTITPKKVVSCSRELNFLSFAFFID